MKAKRYLALLFPAALALCAFGQAPAPRTVAQPAVLMQFMTVVNADGSAEFHYELKYSKEQVQKDLDKGDYSEDEVCANTTSALEDNIGTFKQEKHGDEIWCTYAMTFDNLQGLHNHLEDHFSLNVRRLEIKDDKFYLDLSWYSLPCDNSDPSQFSCEWAVQAPGKPGANNATKVSGNLLTWDLTASGATHDFTAESAVGGFDPTVVILLVVLLGCCCCTILLIAAGVGIFFYLRRKKASTEGADVAPSSPPAASPTDTVKL